MLNASQHFDHLTRTLSSEKEYTFGPRQHGEIAIPSAFMRDSMGVLFDTTPLKVDQGTGLHRIRNWFSETCIFTQMDADAFAVRKTRPQSANGAHLVFVHRYTHGRLRGRIGDLNIDRDPGSIYILDQESRVECVQTPATMQAMLIPKSAIGFNNDRHASMVTVPGDHILGQTLNSLFDELFDGLLNQNSLSFTTFDRIVASLRIALHGEREDQDVRRFARDAMAAQISAHVEQNLAQWDLGVNTLLRDFGVSRASLYRMFEPYGGVRQYISDRRLLRAVLEITDRPLVRGQIAETAERWGFSSSASFNRSVRREFGVAPGSLLNERDDGNESVPKSRTGFVFRDASGRKIERLAQSELLLPS